MGWNFKAMEEIGPERRARATKPNTEPMKEYTVANFRALFASPLLLKG